MLHAWSLTNFKSVTEQTDLELGKLTIFTGANSAGKSTIIQSILLTAQSLQSSVTNRPVIMNGHMARLGSFRDVVSSADRNRAIAVGFSFSPESLGMEATSTTRFIGQRLHYFGGDGPSNIQVSYSFSAVPGPNDPSDSVLDLQPRLEAAKVLITYQTEEGIDQQDQISVERAKASIAERSKQYSLNESDIPADQLESLRYSASSTKIGHKVRLEGLSVTTQQVGAVMHHFLPRAVTARYDSVEAAVATQLNILTQPSAYARRYGILGLRAKVGVKATDLICQILGKVMGSFSGDQNSAYWLKSFSTSIEKFAATRSLEAIHELHAKVPSRVNNMISSAMEESKAELRKLLRNDRPADYLLDVQYPAEQMSIAVDQVQNFFSNFLKYLGPLRDEPKPLYPLAGSSDTTDVGFRGEHTAAVLDVHKETLINFVSSKNFASDSSSDFEPTYAPLSAAVDDWLDYMGVGKNSITSDSGKLGHTLKVKTQGSELEHDLTQVGVGVSQVLPILVLALIAEVGSTLIFEQPELHLHPRVQSRLADFFVSMTKLGKQCIVETHSEYLINRLRFRSASEEGSDVSKSVVIYFVEKESARSRYRPVRIDELGNLDNWPEGFFDESEISTTALLKKSLSKRRRNLEKN